MPKLQKKLLGVEQSNKLSSGSITPATLSRVIPNTGLKQHGNEVTLYRENSQKAPMSAKPISWGWLY